MMSAGWIAGAWLLLAAGVPAEDTTVMSHADRGDVVADRSISPAQLATLLARAPLRIELEVSRDGRVVDADVDDDDVREEDEVEGRVVAIDAAAKTVTVEHVGVVFLADARELELHDDRDVGLDVWITEVTRALAAGERFGVEVDGRFRADGFTAHKIEVERGFETEVKATIRSEHFHEATAILRLGGVAYDLSKVQIEYDD